MNTLLLKLNSARTCSFALAALLLAFALPATALGQDPAADQYAPGPTDAPPPDPSNDPTDPIPNDTNASGGPGGDSGDSGSGDGSSTGVVGDTVTPVVPSSGVTDPTGVTGTAATTATGEVIENKAQRDLARIAEGAAQQRAETGEGPLDANPATELLRSDSGGGLGMGPFLWVLLAGTLAWAIGSGIIRHRQDGHTA